MKVKAKLTLNEDYVILNIPTDKCNLEDFLPYIKEQLMNDSLKDKLKVQFELC